MHTNHPLMDPPQLTSRTPSSITGLQYISHNSTEKRSPKHSWKWSPLLNQGIHNWRVKSTTILELLAKLLMVEDYLIRKSEQIAGRNSGGCLGEVCDDNGNWQQIQLSFSGCQGDSNTPGPSGMPILFSQTQYSLKKTNNMWTYETAMHQNQTFAQFSTIFAIPTGGSSLGLRRRALFLLTPARPDAKDTFCIQTKASTPRQAHDSSMKNQCWTSQILFPQREGERESSCQPQSWLWGRKLRPG